MAEKGFPGETGLPGLRGSQGIPGDIGPEGPPGPFGPNGDGGSYGGMGEKGHRVNNRTSFPWQKLEFHFSNGGSFSDGSLFRVIQEFRALLVLEASR